MDFFTVSEKKEGSIKTIFIDGQLHDKTMLCNGKWINICVYDKCKLSISSSNLCSKHLKQCNRIFDGTLFEKNGVSYVKHGTKFIIKCKLCTNPSEPGGYCKDHIKFKNTKETVGSVEDIMRNFDPNLE